ncbi:MAG TPA: GNAT family N-acetyltransferase [Pirellulaceae bacterium]|nr:GNAT family N-acetyltransferase [Pirellulaceae bacterium]HMO93449.1 GNAT family N-acetyltransferase [Pirellulaceae bacterium]HMP68443.1 GNAT family N-acetyltransferase [Pirellulaceae bacterium]
MIEINQIETRRFGVICARLIDTLENIPDLNEVNRFASEKKIAMISARVNVSNLAIVHKLEADGYRLMDTLVYFQRETNDLPQLFSPDNLVIRHSNINDKEAVACIAQVAFQGYLGRYHADTRLADQHADEAYTEWAEECVLSASAESPVLVSVRGGKIVGFAAIRRNNADELEIVLNAVHPSERRCGIYSSLVVKSLHLANENRCKRLLISTQINNYSVQRIWSRLGFVHFKSIYTFHKWF